MAISVEVLRNHFQAPRLVELPRIHPKEIELPRLHLNKIDRTRVILSLALILSMAGFLTSGCTGSEYDCYAAKGTYRANDGSDYWVTFFKNTCVVKGSPPPDLSKMCPSGDANLVGGVNKGGKLTSCTTVSAD